MTAIAMDRPVFVTINLNIRLAITSVPKLPPVITKIISNIFNTLMTIVVVTHELESAFKIADRITVLDKGHILMTGTVAEVKASDNERIQSLLNRRPNTEELAADEYLARLTG